MKRVCFVLFIAGCIVAPAAEPRIARVDDHIYRGRQPNDGEFAQLKGQGVKTILDLRGGPIHKPREKKKAEAAGLQYVSIRLSGIWEPHDSQMAQILGVMEDPGRWPVFIHCRRGDDRLGMVIACYRMSHDHWNNAKAFDEATHLGMSRFEVLMRRYIRNFDPARVQPVSAQASR